MTNRHPIPWHIVGRQVRDANDEPVINASIPTDQPVLPGIVRAVNSNPDLVIACEALLDVLGHLKGFQLGSALIADEVNQVKNAIAAATQGES